MRWLRLQPVKSVGEDGGDPPRTAAFNPSHANVQVAAVSSPRVPWQGAVDRVMAAP